MLEYFFILRNSGLTDMQSNLSVPGQDPKPLLSPMYFISLL